MSVTNVTVNPNELEDYTPEAIAHTLFSSDPKPPCSCQIISQEEATDLTYIFEILMTIFIEGLEILAGDLSKANLDNLTEEHVSALNPWFESLGFNINVNTHPRHLHEAYKGYYCKIMIKDKQQEALFNFKNIDKNYHFFINGDYLEENKLKGNIEDLHAIFIVNDTVFRLNYDFYQIAQ